IEFLDRQAHARPGIMIQGSVQKGNSHYSDGRSSDPLEGIAIRIEGQNQSAKVMVLVGYSQANRLSGIVHSGGKDVNLSMIESGMARYKDPEAYTMSRYTACLYRIAEGEARQAKRGIWHNPLRE